MDVDRIFSIFNDSKGFDEIDSEKELSYLLENYKEHPLFWVGMFKKLIHNHKVFNKGVVSFFSKMKDDELNLYDIEQAGEFIVYSRAWFWVSKLNTSDRICQDALLYYADEYLKTYLKSSISYWEETEEYEKCAHLKKLIDFL